MTTSDFLTGQVLEADRTMAVESIDWQVHPSFEGVAMKTIVTGEQTDGRLSRLLIKIAPNKAIGWHRHGDQVEIHSVIGGSGTCRLEKKLLDYKPGAVGLIGQGLDHAVTAGPEGLCLIAEFVPASR